MTELGITQVYLMAPDYDAGRQALAAFRRSFAGEIVGEVYTEFGATDYTSPIAEMRTLDPESLFVSYPGGMGTNFMRQFNDAGLRDVVPLYATSLNGDDRIVDLAGESNLGLLNSSQWSNDLANDANLEFVSEFQATYGRNPTTFGPPTSQAPEATSSSG